MKFGLRICLIFGLWAGWTLTACAGTAPAPPTPTEAPSFHGDVQSPLISEDTVAEDPVQPAWTARLSGAVNVPPVVSGDLVIVATADGQIHAVNAATGAMVWSFVPEERLWDASLRVAGPRICTGLEGGLVTCLNAETGEPLWMTAVGQEMQSRPALVEDVLYVPTTHVGTGLENDYDGQASLFALDAGSGQVIWEAATGNYILRRPIVAGDLVITGGTYDDKGESKNGSPNRI